MLPLAVPLRSWVLRVLVVVACAGGCKPAQEMPAGPASTPAAGGTGGGRGLGGGGAGQGGGSPAQGSGGSGGAAGTGGVGGGAGTGGTGGTGGGAMAGSPGRDSGGGSPTSDARPRDGGAADTANSSGPGWAGIPGIEDLSTVKPTPGCGMDPGQALGQWVRSTVTIMPRPPRGTGNRVYFIKLPAAYDRNKPYRLIFVVPGCNGSGDRMFDYTDAAGAEGVIQIGLNPDPGGGSGPGCFDDFRADSVEYKFFETLLDVASKKLCFDQHRVYFTGHSSGSFVSNMMGCVYGSTRVRAVAPSSGGLATEEMVLKPVPSCSDLPTPGIWSHNEDDGVGLPGNLIKWTKYAINRALKANRCQGDYDTSPRVPYPGEPDCQQFSTCPREFPIVLCHPRTGGHEGNLTQQPARAWKFFKLLP